MKTYVLKYKGKGLSPEIAKNIIESQKGVSIVRSDPHGFIVNGQQLQILIIEEQLKGWIFSELQTVKQLPIGRELHKVKHW